MATSVHNVRKLQDEILDLTNFNANSWIYMIKIKVSMYLGIICRPVSEPLGCYLVPFLGLQFLSWIHLPQ